MNPAAAVLAAVLVFAFLQTAAGYWVLWQVQKKAHVRIEGRFIPSFLWPSFRLEHAKVIYQDRFEADGRLKVRYNLLPFSPDLLHVWIDGSGMDLRLLGKWAEVRSVEKEARLDRFKAELELMRRGVVLHAADIQSTVFQFQLKKSENHKGQLLG